MTPNPPTPAGIEILPTRAGYDRWAEFYDGEDNPLVLLEEQHIGPLLGDVVGLDVADIGCGTGRHAIPLAASGARVTAIDFSEEMLRRARVKPGADAVTFVHHDLARPLPLKEGAFDLVLSCLVLDHIADLDAFFRELRRVCKSGGEPVPAPSPTPSPRVSGERAGVRGTELANRERPPNASKPGRVVISVMHPAMSLQGVQARFIDPSSGRRISPQSCVHQISDYLMAALRAGLALDYVSEHSVDAELAARSPRAVKYLDWPLLLLMRLVPARQTAPTKRQKFKRC